MLARIIRWTVIPIAVAAIASATIGSGWSYFRWRTVWGTPDPPYEIASVVRWKAAAWVTHTAEDEYLVEPLSTDFDRSRWMRTIRRRHLLPDPTRALRTNVEAAAQPEAVLDQTSVEEIYKAIHADRPWSFGSDTFRSRSAKEEGALGGVMALGVDSSGNDLVLISLFGPEISNDHYPIVEALWHPKSKDLDASWYYVDIAGIEGITAQRVATGWFVVLGIIAAIVSIVGLLRSALPFNQRPLRGVKSPAG